MYCGTTSVKRRQGDVSWHPVAALREGYNQAMPRLQAFKYALIPNADQQRQMRRFAGSCRYVFNHALELQKERFAQGEKKLERAYSNFFAKRVAFPRFKKKGQAESFRRVGWEEFRSRPITRALPAHAATVSDVTTPTMLMWLVRSMLKTQAVVA